MPSKPLSTKPTLILSLFSLAATGLAACGQEADANIKAEAKNQILQQCGADSFPADAKLSELQVKKFCGCLANELTVRTSGRELLKYSAGFEPEKFRAVIEPIAIECAERSKFKNK